MRILVTGACGFVGSRLVKAMSTDHDVTAICRSPAEFKKARVIECDMLDRRSLMRRLRDLDFDIVYHLAAELDESAPDLWAVNVEGTRNILDVMKNRSLKRFILLSPIGVLGKASKPSQEDDPYNPDTAYEKSKMEAERIVMDYRLKYNVPYTIIRATIICGPNETWKQMLTYVKEGNPIIGRGDNSWHLVYIDDVVQALQLAMKAKAKNQIYHVAGPDAHTYGETYFMMKKILKVRGKTKNVPVIAARALALAQEARERIRGKKPSVVMLQSSIKRLLRQRNVSIKKIKQDLGYKPRYDLKKALRKAAKELNFL